MKALDKRSFRRITLLIVVSLVVLAGLQFYWLVRMYGEADRRFVEKATAAMERAAYDELTTRPRTARKIEITEMFDGAASHGYSYTVGNHARVDTLKGSVSAVRGSGGSGASGASGVSSTSSTSSTSSVSGVSGVSSVDSLFTNITVHNGRNVDTRMSVITLVATEQDLSRDNFVRYDSLLRLNLARADIVLPYRLSVMSGDGELQALGDEVAHPRTFDIPVGSRRASVVRLSIENPNRTLLREMAGLVVSSVLTVVLLAFTLIYLLRTLFRQKTLEGMRVDFTHNVTHELKTPIAVAYAAADALLNFGADDDPLRRDKYLRVVQTQLDTLSGMVERILSLSLEDDLRPRKQHTELLPVVRSVVETHRLRGMGDLRVDVPEGLVVWADPFQLSIVIGNLVDNAVKYSGPAAEVAIDAFRDDARSKHFSSRL